MKTNVTALLSLIFGIIGLFVLPLWLGILSLILGIVGLNTANSINSGKGMATAGVVLGTISITWYFLQLIILSAV